MILRLSLALLPVMLSAAPAEDCWQHAKSGRRDQALSCFLIATRSNDAWAQAEGFWYLGDFKASNEAFRAAVKSRDKDPEIRVRWGRMFLERGNTSDSADLFNEALALKPAYPPALLGIALTAAESYDRRALDYAAQALKADPNLVEVRELLAALHLEDVNHSKAREEAEAALKLSPSALDAHALLATIEILNDRASLDPASNPPLAKMLAANPVYGHGFARIAHWLVLNRRYSDAIAAYRQALALDPSLDRAKSQLAINLMRIGEDAEARKLLVECYENGLRNAATVNTLRLLDSYPRFRTIKTPRAIIKLHSSEADLLEPYVVRETERAITTYEKKYGLTLPGPVQLEFYPDHEDFAVRTMGMPGLGALGVTFGLAVAMDSPSGRPPGEFHWASTLWHELSHVFALVATNHRVPRWFTEGLAVHEETATNPEWGDRLAPPIVQAMKEKKLLPIATLDRGFIRPAYPQQVIVSYFQAGRICDYIQQRWGWAKLREMLDLFKQVRPTSEVVQTALSMTAEDFDKQFLAWLEKEHATPLAGYDAFMKGLKQLKQDLASKDDAALLKTAAAMEAAYPEYVESGNPYETAADALIRTGDKPKAREWLWKYVRRGGRSPEAIQLLSKLEEEAGNVEKAVEVLERQLWIYPVKDEALHSRLGEMRATLGRWPGAAEEFAAVVAMKPADPAQAHFRLANAYKNTGRLDAAQEHVLLALEAAPGYRPAQKLLLELNSLGDKPQGRQP
ncbi:MAG: tetratricopeptide repeat protein [Bryobacteraceae bacterium]|nr:tetratricopeptide repeat protein [Bryobacteraceae bacterium]